MLVLVLLILALLVILGILYSRRETIAKIDNNVSEYTPLEIPYKVHSEAYQTQWMRRFLDPVVTFKWSTPGNHSQLIGPKPPPTYGYTVSDTTLIGSFLYTGITTDNPVTPTTYLNTTNELGTATLLGKGTEFRVSCTPNTLYHVLFVVDGVIVESTTCTSSPQAESTLMLLHADAFIDSSLVGSTITPNGLASIDPVKLKYGTGSLYTPDVNSYILTSNDPRLRLGSSDFTIELWFNASALSGPLCLIANGTTNVLGIWRIVITSGKQIQFACASQFNMIVSAVTLATNTWYHVAVCRKDNLYTVFINGQSRLTYTHGSSITLGFPSNHQVYVPGAFTSFARFVGYIDEVRITNGYALYPSNLNFTPTQHPDPVQTITPATISWNLSYDAGVLTCSIGSPSYEILYNTSDTPIGATHIGTSASTSFAFTPVSGTTYYFFAHVRSTMIYPTVIGSNSLYIL